MARTDNVRTYASLNGVPLGEFRTFSGGELTSTDQKSSRGGGQTERSRGGRKTIGNVTIVREWDGDDLLEYGKYRGKPDLFVVTRQPFDDDNNKRGKGMTFTCTLVRVAPGGGDASGDALDDLELEGSVSDVA